MDTHKQIAKALLNKTFAEAKELVFKSLYAKASLALDEARFAVANSVFNEAAKTTGVPAGASEDKFTAARAEIKKAGHKAKLGKGVPAGSMKEEAEQIDEAELDEMAITAARAREHNRAIDRADYKAWAYTNPDNRQGMWKNGKAKSPAHIKKGKALEKAYDSAVSKLERERAAKKTYGRGGKVVKEASEQLDEVSPPDMEKMTGSKKTKASFAKQYGKRGKSVMYATAWKLHNKKAQD